MSEEHLQDVPTVPEAALPAISATDAVPDPEPRSIVLLTAEEVASILKLKSARSVYKLAARHRWGFARRIGDRSVRYERRGLLQWIKRRPHRASGA